MVKQPPEFGEFSVVSLQLKVWSRMFNGSVALLDAFQAGCNSSFIVLSAVCHDTGRDPYGSAPNLPGASICLGGR